MLRITKLSDYAVVVLQNLAACADPSCDCTSREIAERTGIPRPTVSKVMKDLARAGVLSSQRGAQGGFCLAREPGRISLAEIIEAVEGPIALTECNGDGEGSCDFTGACPVEENWLRINQVVRSALDGISLADMAAPRSPALLNLGRAPEAEIAAPSEER